MAVGTIIFIGVLQLIVISAIVVYIMWKIHGKRQEPENEQIILNGLSKNCGGHFLGLRIDEKENKEFKRYKITPRDVNSVKLKNKEIDVKDQIIYARKDLIIPWDFSTHRDVIHIFPKTFDEFPPKLKNHPIGKYFRAFYENEIYPNENIRDILLSRQEVIKERALKSLDLGGELAKEGYQELFEVAKDLKSLEKKEEENKEK